MAGSEFDLISQYFSRLGGSRDDVLLGVGDDCALLQVPEGMQLAVSIDTLNEGVHFFPGSDPESLGHKVLAVNLSDLAAIGAEPAWATLALTLPAIDDDWLRAFSKGFGRLAEIHKVRLVGGDTTRGKLAATVQVHGFVTPGQALRRDGAEAGQLIGITGSLGDAGLALRLLQRGEETDSAGMRELRLRLDRPTPQLAVGRALSGIAGAAIDISDGLLADLGHICARSGVGADIKLDLLPLSPQVADFVRSTGDWRLPVAAGDDYVLCVTVAPDRQGLAESRARQAGSPISWIGEIKAQPGVHCWLPDGSRLTQACVGYDHFG